MAGFMQEFSASGAQQTMNICFGERLWSLILILDTGLWYSFYCSALKKKVVLWRNEQPDYFPRAYNKMECLFISSCALRYFEPKNFWVSLGLFSVSLRTGTPGMAGQWEHSQCNITCLKTQTPSQSFLWRVFRFATWFFLWLTGEQNTSIPLGEQNTSIHW